MEQRSETLRDMKYEVQEMMIDILGERFNMTK